MTRLRDPRRRLKIRVWVCITSVESKGGSKTYRAFIGLLEAAILFFAMKSTLCGAPGGTRTPTPLREADFESAASTVPPQRHFREASHLHRPDIAHVRPGFNGFGDRRGPQTDVEPRACSQKGRQHRQARWEMGEGAAENPTGPRGRSKYSAALIAGNATPEASAIKSIARQLLQNCKHVVSKLGKPQRNTLIFSSRSIDNLSVGVERVIKLIRIARWLSCRPPRI